MAEKMSYIAKCRHGYVYAALRDERNPVLRQRYACEVGEWVFEGATVQHVPSGVVKLTAGTCPRHGDCAGCNGLGPVGPQIPEQQELFDATL